MGTVSETQTLTLTDFLLARIAEDQARVRPGVHEPESWCDRAEGVHYESARVRAECEAKRRIIAACLLRIEDGEDGLGNIVTSGGHLGEAILQALALPYADHPDYREEWR